MKQAHEQARRKEKKLLLWKELKKNLQLPQYKTPKLDAIKIKKL